MPDPPYTIVADAWIPKNKVVFMSIDPALDRPAVSWVMVDEVDVWGDLAEIERRLAKLERELEVEQYVLNKCVYNSAVYWQQRADIEVLEEKILKHRMRLPGIDC